MKALITGGAGFIGSNLADLLLAKGNEVIIYDNLSRYGSALVLAWLREKHGSTALQLICGDVRDFQQLLSAICTVDVVFHCAAQVAVTTSVSDPRLDFEVNALGTFNVLEAARQSPAHRSVHIH